MNINSVLVYKSKIAIFLLLVLLSFTNTSCENEPIDPALLQQNPVLDCATPNGLSVSGFIGTSVNLVWSAAQGSSWEIQYGPDNFTLGSGTTIIATTANATINGLTITNNYNFYIRTSCGNGSYSDWIGPVAVGSSLTLCSNPTNLVAVRAVTNATQITVTWSQQGDENTWEVQYGASGFALGAGTTANATATTKLVTGLLGTLGYDFYVRSNCTDGNSTWVGPVNVPAIGNVAGDYWPTAINNQWVFDLNGATQAPLKIVSSDIVAGNTYYTFQPIVGPASATVRIRKVNGDYYYRTEDVVTAGAVTSGSETIILKDYLPVNGSWTNSFSQTTTFVSIPPVVINISIVSTILEKNSTVTVNGQNYTNVIKVKRVQTATGASIPVSTTTGFYWYAKDIGPVKVANGTDIQNLESYLLN
ncbi:MAG: hypothetical protein H7199_00525 [Burkholderiales bacterium]|nr:hypothetical protein [Flavobacterium sp.]